MNKALVICLISGEYTLYDLSTSKTLLAKPRGVFRNNQTTVKVGDIVYYEDGNPFATIVKVEPRKNDLVRPTIANIDHRAHHLKAESSRIWWNSDQCTPLFQSDSCFSGSNADKIVGL